MTHRMNEEIKKLLLENGFRQDSDRDWVASGVRLGTDFEKVVFLSMLVHGAHNAHVRSATFIPDCISYVQCGEGRSAQKDLAIVNFAAAQSRILDAPRVNTYMAGRITHVAELTCGENGSVVFRMREADAEPVAPSDAVGSTDDVLSALKEVRQLLAGLPEALAPALDAEALLARLAQTRADLTLRLGKTHDALRLFTAYHAHSIEASDESLPQSSRDFHAELAQRMHQRIQQLEGDYTLDRHDLSHAVGEVLVTYGDIEFKHANLKKQLTRCVQTLCAALDKRFHAVKAGGGNA